MTVIAGENSPTAQKVIEHLRAYGPAARVLLLVGGRKPENTLRNQEIGPILGKVGLLRMYGDEFPTGNLNRVELTHFQGGKVTICTVGRAETGILRGKLFSVVWFENIDPDRDAVAIKDAKNALRLTPCMLIESHDALTFLTSIE